MYLHHLLYVHPVWQICATLLVLYPAWLGIKRLVGLHLGKQISFNRRRHILVGKAALAALLAGTAGGLVMVRLFWYGWLLTGLHAWLGLAAACLMAFGLVSGLVMQKSPAPRRALPLAHGLANLAALALCLAQFDTGSHVMQALLVGE